MPFTPFLASPVGGDAAVLSSALALARAAWLFLPFFAMAKETVSGAKNRTWVAGRVVIKLPGADVISSFPLTSVNFQGFGPPKKVTKNCNCGLLVFWYNIGTLAMQKISCKNWGVFFTTNSKISNHWCGNDPQGRGKKQVLPQKSLIRNLYGSLVNWGHPTNKKKHHVTWQIVYLSNKNCYPQQTWKDSQKWEFATLHSCPLKAERAWMCLMWIAADD